MDQNEENNPLLLGLPITFQTWPQLDEHGPFPLGQKWCHQLIRVTIVMSTIADKQSSQLAYIQRYKFAI